MTEQISYPMADTRAKAYINQDDIDEAIKLFEKQFKQKPSLVLLCPKLVPHFKTGIPDISITPHAGVATWEIRLGGGIFPPPPPCETNDALQSKSGDVSKIPGEILPKKIMKQPKRYIQPLPEGFKTGGRGRPPIPGEVSRSTAWRRRKKLQGVLSL
jgi:hypothetical protein